MENNTEAFLRDLSRLSHEQFQSASATSSLMKTEPKPYSQAFTVMAAATMGRNEMMADVIDLVNRHFPETVDKTVKV